MQLFKKFSAWPLGQKMTGLLLVQGILIFLIVGILIGWQGGKVLRNMAEKQAERDLELIGMTASEAIEWSIAILKAITESPSVRSRVEQSLEKSRLKSYEQAIKDLEANDSKWVEAHGEEPWLEPYLRSPQAMELRAFTQRINALKEVFTTDSYGALVNASSKTSDFYQGDESWWQETFDQGRGKPFLEDLEYDESAGTLAYAMSVPIQNSEGVVIGVVKGVFDARNITDPIMSMGRSSNSAATIVDSQGGSLVPLSPNIKKTYGAKAESLPSELYKSISGRDKGHFRYKSPEGDDLMVGFRKIEHPIFETRSWYLVYWQKWNAFIEPFRLFIFALLGAAVLTILAVLLLGYMLSLMIEKPLFHFRQAIETLGTGNFKKAVIADKNIPKDDLGSMMHAYNDMVHSLEKTTVSRDQLEVKNKELEELIQQRAHFTSVITHELRTPLVVLLEGLAQLDEGLLGEINEKQKKYMAMLIESVRRLNRNVDDLLDMSKLDAGKLQISPETIDIVSVLKHIEATFQARMKSRGLEMKLNVSKEKIMVKADRERVIQVFVNLVGNAIKFTPSGHIELSAKEGNMVECCVSDTGPGIAKEELSKVFDKFNNISTASVQGEKGTGLGLSISKEIVELHGGEIRVESKVGEGTKFIFTLPRAS